MLLLFLTFLTIFHSFSERIRDHILKRCKNRKLIFESNIIPYFPEFFLRWYCIYNQELMGNRMFKFDTGGM